MQTSLSYDPDTGNWFCATCNGGPFKEVSKNMRLQFNVREIGRDQSEKLWVRPKMTQALVQTQLGAGYDSYAEWDVAKRDRFWKPFVQKEYMLECIVRNRALTIINFQAIAGAEVGRNVRPRMEQVACT